MEMTFLALRVGSMEEIPATNTYAEIVSVKLDSGVDKNFDNIDSPLLVFITVSLAWGILFSPFGADARWISTLLLWLYLSMTISFNYKKA